MKKYTLNCGEMKVLIRIFWGSIYDRKVTLKKLCTQESIEMDECEQTVNSLLLKKFIIWNNNLDITDEGKNALLVALLK